MIETRGVGADAAAWCMAVVRLMELHRDHFTTAEVSAARAEYFRHAQAAGAGLPPIPSSRTPEDAAELREGIVNRSRVLYPEVLSSWRASTDEVRKFRRLCGEQQVHMDAPSCGECNRETGAWCAVVREQLDQMAELISEFTDEEREEAFGKGRRT
ncbi:hypothetical protein [Streptomyces sp. NPDC048057]|uniref:hypothetical protein n=1 Tax=Streptomyces sp. NPDC048057 TaxID=3155628 RepID=UPI00340446B4